jgi:hypothetical protein
VKRYVRSTYEEKTENLGKFANALDKFSDVTKDEPMKFNLKNFMTFLPKFLRTQEKRERRSISPDSHGHGVHSHSIEAAKKYDDDSHGHGVHSHSIEAVKKYDDDSHGHGVHSHSIEAVKKYDDDSHGHGVHSHSIEAAKKYADDSHGHGVHSHSIEAFRNEAAAADETIDPIQALNGVWGPMTIKNLSTYIRNLDPNELENFLTSFVQVLQNNRK